MLDSKADPAKLDLAEQAYLEALKYPASVNPVFPDTLLRLGEINLSKHEGAKAKLYFDRLRADFPSSAAAGKIPAGQ